MSDGADVRNVAHGVSARNLVQARDVGHIHFHNAAPARSRYREQVREIAPAELVGREAELADLAEFCAAQTVVRPYLWVRAAKWVGKSALLSWFVLHPPVNVRVVSFFVTARYGDQDHRGAFLDNVMEQLADLLDEPTPPALTDANREAHFRGLLADAAEHCRGKGERLVLVVDGLDEDRGWRAGAITHSIAALLPSRPSDGLRVLVSGRPNPPLPADVRAGHPLRDPEIAYPLASSRAALVIRDDMELELTRLLDGTPAEQDLLGLTVTAAGGLSAADLAELTGSTEPGVRRLLRTVAGRSFDVRPSRWQPETRPEVYLLGHEELQLTAIEHIGPARLDGYRERLHDWADSYRAQGWPARTPEYLMRGYFRLLVATGDLPRMIELTTDAARHDRMSDASGGDLPPVAELDIVRNALLESPDLVSIARIAVHRDRLEYRNGTMPSALPAVWAALGHTVRAEALARMLYGANLRASALVAVIGTIARSGDLDRARTLVDSIAEPDARVAGLAAVAEAATGDLARVLTDTAEELLDQVAPERYGRAVAAVIAALVRIGEIDRAMTRYESGGGGRGITESTLRLVRALLAAGRDDLARAVAARVVDPSECAHAFLTVAEACGDRDAVAEAERRIRLINGSLRRQAATTAMVKALAATGDVEAAAALADGHDEPGLLAESHTILAAALAKAGNLDAARESRRAAASAAAEATGGWRANILTELAVVTATAGDLDDAVAIASSIDQIDRRSAALTALAEVMVAMGRLADATTLASAAESIARDSGVADRRDQQACQLAGNLTTFGEFDQAETVVAVVTDDRMRGQTRVDLVTALAVAGQPAQAETLARLVSWSGEATAAVVEAWVGAGEVERAAAIVRDTGYVNVLVRFTLALCVRGDLDDAVAAAESISNPQSRMRTLVRLAKHAHEAGRQELADSLGETVESLAEWLAVQDSDAAPLLLDLVSVFADYGEFDRAERIATTMPEWPEHHGLAPPRLPQLSRLFGESVDRPDFGHFNLDGPRGEAFVVLYRRLVAAGEVDRAEAVARTGQLSPWILTDREKPAAVRALPSVEEDDVRERLLRGQWVYALPQLGEHRDALFAVVEEFLALQAHSAHGE